MANHRKYWLDHIRWSTVILVLVYHVFYLYNGVGIPGGIPGSTGSALGDTFSQLVYPWFMVLLFLVSGISARYALQTRSHKEFLKERTRKLLIPSTLGLFVLHWITGYYNIRIGGGLEFIPGFLLYPICAISGTGPLWFIQMLYLFSCLLVLLRKLDKQERIYRLCGKAGVPVILGMFFLLWGGAQIGNLPVLTMYRFGIYFVSFFLGYCFFSQDAVMAQVQKLRLPALMVALISGTVYAFRFYGTNFTLPGCLQNWLTNLYLWSAVLAILGWSSICLNGQNRFTAYMTRSSFGFYILHYPCALISAYYLSGTNLPLAAKYVIAMAVMFVVTWAVYEILSRIPVVRLLVLGRKRG